MATRNLRISVPVRSTVFAFGIRILWIVVRLQYTYVRMLHDIKIFRAAMKNQIQATTSSEDTHLKYRDIFNERYYMFNKQLLYAAGLWPYQPFKQKAVRTSVPLIASIIIMAAQVRAMIKAWGEFNLFAECIAPLTMNVAGIIKLTCGLSYSQEMRKLFDGMQKDWEAMRHLPQINILEKYGEQGRLWTICYFTLFYVIVCGWVVMAFSPKIMDALIPLNYSRRRFDLFPTDFMVDPDDYFYPILIFITVTLMYHIIVYVSIDTLYMVLAQHERAMFEILRYNLDNVLEDDESTDIILKPDIYKDTHYRKLIACIKEHKVIIEFIKTIESMCEWKLLIIVGLNMVCLSFTGYMVIVTRDDSSIVDTLRFAFFSIAQVFHLFCITLPSHWIMESSSLIPNAAYSSRWYMMSLRSRKLTLFLIRASIEPCNITAGKIYIMSVENFSGVLQTSMSYLTMLNSIQ